VFLTGGPVRKLSVDTGGLHITCQVTFISTCVNHSCDSQKSDHKTVTSLTKNWNVSNPKASPRAISYCWKHAHIFFTLGFFLVSKGHIGFFTRLDWLPYKICRSYLNFYKVLFKYFVEVSKGKKKNCWKPFNVGIVCMWFGMTSAYFWFMAAVYRGCEGEPSLTVSKHQGTGAQTRSRLECVGGRQLLLSSLGARESGWDGGTFFGRVFCLHVDRFFF
jgi:hypothetical protein